MLTYLAVFAGLFVVYCAVAELIDLFLKHLHLTWVDK